MKKILFWAVIIIIVFIAGLYALAFWNRYANTPIPGDGIYFGFIRSMSEDGRIINFDDARWLTGTEGEDAAIANGICTEKTRSECLPNDFFIQNVSTSTEALHLSDEVVVAMMTLNMEGEGIQETDIEASELARMINDKSLHWKDLPYQILVQQGEVTIIEEVYVP